MGFSLDARAALSISQIVNVWSVMAALFERAGFSFQSG